MTSDASRSRYHPLRWHLVTWVLVILWFTFACLTNLPLGGDPRAKTVAPPAAAPPAAAATGTVTLPALSLVVVTGFPIFNCERKFAGKPTDGQLTVRPVYAAIDFILLVVNLVAMIWILQRSDRYSIRSMLLAVTVAAFMIVAVQAVLTRGSFWEILFLMTAIYFAPSVIGIMILIKSRWSQDSAVP
ncbi:MAG: hypothetical protein HKN47_07410 [Pirellulaceae bacterium]|nr:hypothetical protein [Pirellulaceae bacterium]